ncbi:MAG: hypothetical protein J5838_03640, partial [Desulfovibrio sp.]|nr:hypothetical protein [Desulfovibrio sp.]
MPFFFMQRLFFGSVALFAAVALSLAAPVVRSHAGLFAGEAFAAPAKGDEKAARPLQESKPSAAAPSDGAVSLTPEEERAMAT